MQSVINFFPVYGGQNLHPYYQAEPATVNNKQDNLAVASLSSFIIKKR